MTPLSRQYVKLCDIRDFDDPDLLRAIRTLLPERDPLAHVERKVWEFAMTLLFLEETGHLNDRSDVLSVGAGDERIVFWLSNHVGRMVATDIYGEGSFAGNEAQVSMLEDPGAHAPVQFGWRPDRLEVLKMDGRQLDFPDNSFDAVFTISSIEHFGGHADIARAAAEIGRVLRPGGHAVIVTEYMIRRHPFDTGLAEWLIRLGSHGKRFGNAVPWRRINLGEVLTRRELYRHVIRASGLELMQPLDTTLSADSWQNLVTQLPDGGGLSFAAGKPYPLILVRVSRSVFTSVCLVLSKPDP